MKFHLVRGLLTFLSYLPLRANHALGAVIGWLAWKLPTPARRITLINLALCYPDRDPSFHQQLACQSLVETGKALTELGHLWEKPPDSLAKLVRNVHGREHLLEARKNGNGLVVISPHIGAWELCLLPLSDEQSPIVMYRPPRQAWLEPVLVSGRSGYDIELANLGPGGIKEMLRALRTGRTLGILPDQEPDSANGVFAPFFATTANTMTLLPRLLNRTGASAVFMFCERLPFGRGYDVHYLPANDAIGCGDNTIAATALNDGIRECIRLIPEQYTWSYKRFSLMEDGQRRAYR